MTAFNEKLREAAGNGFELVVKAWLDEPGCDASSEDKSGLNALMYAALGGYEACIELLLPVSDPLAKGKDGMTAWMYATCGNITEACVRLLLPGSDALAFDRYEVTALMCAAEGGHEACIRLLLPVSDVQAKNKWNSTACMLARKGGHESLAQFINTYALAQSERTNIDTTAGPGALSGKPAFRV